MFMRVQIKMLGVEEGFQGWIENGSAGIFPGFTAVACTQCWGYRAHVLIVCG